MIVGSTWVLDLQTQQQIPVNVVEQTEEDTTTYKLMDKEAEVGQVIFKIKKIIEKDVASCSQITKEMTDEKVQHIWHGEKYLFYGPVKDRAIVDKVYIQWICSSNTRYKYAGTKLMQSVVEKSLLSKCEGRVDLNAAESYEFYYSIGLRSVDTEVNAILETALKTRTKGQRVMVWVSSNQMYIPQEALIKLKETISKDPILNLTKESVTSSK
jgi:hypothetical protein